MAVTHSAAMRTVLADAAVDRLDVGAGANGFLVFRTAADAEVATLTLSATAFGAASGPTATANAITSDTNATAGTITKFALQDQDAADMILGAVSTSGSDINLTSVIIGTGDTVGMTSLTYTAPV